VQGYGVRLSQAYMKANVDNPKLPAWFKRISAAERVTSLSMRIYIDGTGLLRRDVTDMTMTVSGISVTGALTMDFSAFGSPVTVTAPPAGEVETIRQFLKTVSAGTPASRTTGLGA